MPKAKLSIEEKILDYFQTAPLDAANVTLRFATKTVRDRTPAAAKPAKAKTPRAPKVHPETATETTTGQPLFKS